MLDAASTTMVLQGAFTGRVFVVATVPVPEDGRATTTPLDQGDDTVRVDVFPLDPADVGKLLRVVLGAPVEQGTIMDLTDACGGSLKALRELILAARTAGTLEQHRGVWRGRGSFPASPTQLERIWSRLPGTRETEDLLTALGVCGPLEIGVVEQLAPADQLIELERDGVIRVRRDSSRTKVELTPSLISIVEGALAPPRRREILLTQAARLRTWGAPDPDNELCRARWLMEAGAPLDPPMLLRGADTALRMHDAPLARLLARVAVGTAPDPMDRLKALVVHGEAAHRLGSYRSAERLLRTAQQRLVEVLELDDGGDCAPRAETLLIGAVAARAKNLLIGLADPGAALAATATAALRVPSPDGRHTLQVSRAAVHVAAGNPERALAILGKPERGLQGDAVSTVVRAMAWIARGRCEDAAELAGNRAFTGSNEPVDASSPHQLAYPVIVAMGEAGQIDEARQTMAAGAPRGEAPQNIWVANARGRCELLAGRPEDASRWFAQALTLAEAIDYRMSRPTSFAGLVAALAQCGRTADALSVAEEAARHPGPAWPHGEEALAAAWSAVLAGDTRQAVGVLLHGARRARRAQNLAAEGFLLTDAVRLEPSAHGAQRLTVISRMAQGRLAPARAAFADAVLKREPDRLVRAAELAEGAGARLLAAEAYALAQQAFAAGGAGRQAEGMSARALAALGGCGPVTTPILARLRVRSISLTDREREIAELAASGRSSPEIAALLSIAVRTVDNHLQRVYAKTGVTSRQDLAEALRRS
ncbi:LuxR C-terminal-related transcriptional regulator [Streptomyces sp. NPDC087908]|uniref:helix-turn-helix transcriptional regulator n=1 Tax=Streptomyces sp. NPDC087908 TaxID=3365820 RepID=UPI00382CE96A